MSNSINNIEIRNTRSKSISRNLIDNVNKKLNNINSNLFLNKNLKRKRNDIIFNKTKKQNINFMKNYSCEDQIYEDNENTNNKTMKTVTKKILVDSQRHRRRNIKKKPISKSNDEDVIMIPDPDSLNEMLNKSISKSNRGRHKTIYVKNLLNKNSFLKKNSNLKINNKIIKRKKILIKDTLEQNKDEESEQNISSDEKEVELKPKKKSQGKETIKKSIINNKNKIANISRIKSKKVSSSESNSFFESEIEEENSFHERIESLNSSVFSGENFIKCKNKNTTSNKIRKSKIIKKSRNRMISTNKIDDEKKENKHNILTKKFKKFFRVENKAEIKSKKYELYLDEQNNILPEIESKTQTFNDKSILSENEKILIKKTEKKNKKEKKIKEPKSRKINIQEHGVVTKLV